MKLLRQISRRLSRLHPRVQAPTIPSICYSSCNNAAIEAQAVGESAGLCDSSSTFMQYYRACQGCVDTYTNNNYTTTHDYLDPEFAQWIAYCNSTEPAPPSSTFTEVLATLDGSLPTPPTSTSRSLILPTTTSRSLTPIIVVVTISYTTNIDGQTTVWPLKKPLTSFPPLPETTVITINTTQDGHSTVWTFTETFTHIPRGTPATTPSDITNTPTPHTTQPVPSSVSTNSVSTNSVSINSVSINSVLTNSVSTSPGSTSPGSTNSVSTNTMPNESIQKGRASIVGPVVGIIAAVIVVLLALWLLRRIRRRRRDMHEVHGESAVKSELEANEKPQELNGRDWTRPPAEMPSTTVHQDGNYARP
ncbi:hypothetical protein F4777DRAFT_557562 [Nemania sp. FL0916]|nr:hypothetical protein F4777DRAFT_557562 [Nemania sp. FL0916]